MPAHSSARIALVTGVSRRIGIGFAIARRLLADAGHWGRPDDVARLVAWLVSPEAAWITGQVLDSEGGFRRWAPIGARAR